MDFIINPVSYRIKIGSDIQNIFEKEDSKQKIRGDNHLRIERSNYR